MKNNIAIFLLITGFLICSIGCTNDDTPSYDKNSLNGTWNVTSYGGGFTGQFTYYEKKDILWNFDTVNKTILIRSQLHYFGPKSGRYPYEIRQNDQNNDVLFLNDSIQGIIYFHEDDLVFVNALVATFER